MFLQFGLLIGLLSANASFGIPTPADQYTAYSLSKHTTFAVHLMYPLLVLSIHVPPKPNLHNFHLCDLRLCFLLFCTVLLPLNHRESLVSPPPCTAHQCWHLFPDILNCPHTLLHLFFTLLTCCGAFSAFLNLFWSTTTLKRLISATGIPNTTTFLITAGPCTNMSTKDCTNHCFLIPGDPLRPLI